MKQDFQRGITEDLDHIFYQSMGLIEEFRDARIFISGGTGFFGTWLLETFARANQVFNLNAEIVILSRNPSKYKENFPHLANCQSLKFITGDVRNFSFPSGSFKYIFHLATEASDHLNRNEPLKMFDVIVEGTRHVLDFAVHAGVESVLLASSGAVYGKQPHDLLHVMEDYTGSPVFSDPVSSYGEGKRVAEMFGSFYSRTAGFQFKIARCFAFVGPYLPLDTHFAIGNFILNGINNNPIFIKGNGTPLRSYLYASDLIIWLLRILINGKSCFPYNVGSEEYISIADLAALVSSCFTPHIPVEFNPNVQKTAGIDRYVPSVQRAMTELGLKQHVSLEAAISKTIRFYKG